MSEDKMVKRSVTLPLSLSERITALCKERDEPFTRFARVILRSAVEKGERYATRRKDKLCES